jgi:tellurite resistance protein TehA-like permease
MEPPTGSLRGWQVASRIAGITRLGIKELLPAYFALVMATGIVSIASHLLEFSTLAQILFIINKAAYIILWILLISRVVFFHNQVVTDIADHLRGPGFFTLVAGTCVLGSQFVLLSGDMLTAGILWGIGLALWLVLIYAVFSILMTKDEKPSLEVGVNGGWLVAVVGTQSISVLGTMLAAETGAWKDPMLFFSLTMYLFGGMLYILIIALIFYRLLFFRLEPAQLSPPYWINMGAVAISTLAGDTLIINAAQWSFLGDLLPFLKGLNLFFWATASWWIPVLVILGVWRHIIKRYTLRYDPLFWSMVFPLGMYTSCTFQLAKALKIESITLIPRYFIYIALATWLFTFGGLLFRLISGLFSSPVPENL